MTWLPRTLFGRNTLLILTLIVFGELTGALLFLEFVQKPRINQLALLAVRQIHSTQALLEALPPEQQLVLIERLNAVQTDAGPEVRITQQPPAPSADISNRDLVMMLFARRVASYLNFAEQDIHWNGADNGTLWAPLPLGDRQYWIGVYGLRTDAGPWRLWLGISLLASTLAVFGAYLIQRRINRPLRTLVAAATQIGKGQSPPLLDENGPTEIATVSRSFNQMSADLKQLDHERAIMIAGVSHDLRTPLAKLRLGLEILDSRNIEHEVLASMSRSTAEMDVIIDQFLNYARSGSNEPLTPVDLEQLVRECVGKYAARGHTVLIDLQDIPLMPLRRHSIERALNNLLENALRYGRPEFHVTGRSVDDCVQISVIDHGPGIPVDEVPILKLPFTRGSTARGGHTGTGLGLAITERIVQSHDGRLLLLTAEGGGLEAKMELPTQR